MVFCGIHFLPTAHAFASLSFPMNIIYLTLLAWFSFNCFMIPLIQLYEYCEFGAVYQWNGDFIPRFYRFVNSFSRPNIYNRSANTSSYVDPPRVAEFLLGVFVKKRYRNGLLQSLEEEFHNDLACMSLNRAKRRYWAAALNSMGPQMLATVKRLGLIGLVVDYLRNRFG
jgi:hypothetical protein